MGKGRESVTPTDPVLLSLIRDRGYQVDRYCPGDGSDGEIENLARELCPLTGQGFMRTTITDELRKDVKCHLECADRIMVVRNGEREPVAFITASMHETDEGLLYHLEGIIVRNDCQGNGMARLLLIEDIRESGGKILGFHTQNARMRALGGKIATLTDECAIKWGGVIGSRNQRETVDVGRYDEKCLYGDIEGFEESAINDINWRGG